MKSSAKSGSSLELRSRYRTKGQKEASGIPPSFRDDVDRDILALSKNPRPHGCKKLTNKEGYRIRTGNYRILYTIDDKAKTVVVYRIKIRGEAYK